uniref:FBD domain-containing protein n=1 Tax=Steinernema glaseri TaxID=37863 RepID=A0A1I7YKD5_9BILA
MMELPLELPTTAPAPKADFSSLAYGDCLCIQKYLSTQNVAKLAGLGSHIWLAASRKTISSRVELYGSLVEIADTRKQGIQLTEFLRKDNGSFHLVREVSDPIQKSKRISELIIKPVISPSHLPISENVVLCPDNCQILCHSFGIPTLPPFIDTNFTSLYIEFCGFKYTEDTFIRLLQSRNLRNLTIKNSELNDRCSEALEKFLATADWETVIMQGKRVPDFMADDALLRNIQRKWATNRQPTYKKLEIYSRLSSSKFSMLSRLFSKEHPTVPGLKTSWEATHNRYYFPLKISFVG